MEERRQHSSISSAASSRREKTNKEAHVRQIDEGCERGRGAGAVCLRDKSTPGPRGSREIEEHAARQRQADTDRLRRRDVLTQRRQLFSTTL